MGRRRFFLFFYRWGYNHWTTYFPSFFHILLFLPPLLPNNFLKAIKFRIFVFWWHTKFAPPPFALKYTPPPFWMSRWHTTFTWHSRKKNGLYSYWRKSKCIFLNLRICTVIHTHVARMKNCIPTHLKKAHTEAFACQISDAIGSSRCRDQCFIWNRNKRNEQTTCGRCL